MSPEGLKSVQVGFHVRATGEQGPDCGQPVTRHDSPWLSWLECTCGASSLTGNVVTVFELLKLLHGHGLKLHAFGMSTPGLLRCWPFLASTDSTAWSPGRAAGSPAALGVPPLDADTTPELRQLPALGGPLARQAAGVGPRGPGTRSPDRPRGLTPNATPLPWVPGGMLGAGGPSAPGFAMCPSCAPPAREQEAQEGTERQAAEVFPRNSEGIVGRAVLIEVFHPPSAGGLPDMIRLKTDQRIGLPLDATINAQHTHMPKIAAYLTFSEIRGRAFRPQVLREFLAKFSWEITFLKLATLAASLANDVSDQRQGSYVAAVEQSLGILYYHHDALMHEVASYVRAQPSRPLVHEQAIYFLQAMALMEGADQGPAPSDLHLATMFLYANDYLSTWRHEDKPKLSDLERMVAELCHVARFNHYPDPLRELVRAELVFSQNAESGPLADQSARHNLEKQAFFGYSFEDYFRAFVTPLYFWSHLWGKRTADGHFQGPVIDLNGWTNTTRLPPELGKRVLLSLACDRQAAKTEIKKNLRNDGLPHAPVLFIRAPFVRTNQDQLIASSPWMLREHLKGGLWGNLMRETKQTLGKADTWTQTFGQLFELACRQIAMEARGSPSFSGEVRLSKGIGTADEFEDVVITKEDAVVLASAKSRLVRESVSRQAESRSALIDWYEDFLFSDRKGAYRAGALRLLDKKIIDIRAAKVPGISENSEIYPLLVTFDDLCENPALYKWIDERCRKLKILQGPKVAPITLVTLEGLESLLSLAANGQSVPSVLREKTALANRFESLKDFLATRSVDGRLLRLPFVDQQFAKITEATRSLLFGEHAVRASEPSELDSKLPDSTKP